MFPAAAKHRIGWHFLCQLRFADWARFGHHVRHELDLLYERPLINHARQVPVMRGMRVVATGCLAVPTSGERTVSILWHYFNELLLGAIGQFGLYTAKGWT
jgi:hypothetical protein